MGRRILVVDDESSIVNGIVELLTEEGYEVVVAGDGDAALRIFAESQPDLVVLDIMMPKKNGFQVCEEMRRSNQAMPILFLSAKGDIVDKSIGFGAGADDYMTKPFIGEELLLRIEALLRRSAPRAVDETTQRDVARIGELEIHFKRHRVYLRGERLDLTPKEFLLLSTMADRPGEAFTTQELVCAVWGEDYAADVTSIAVYIRHLREKIEEDPSKPVYLTTVWRVGYRLGWSSDEEGPAI